VLPLRVETATTEVLGDAATATVDAFTVAPMVPVRTTAADGTEALVGFLVAVEIVWAAIFVYRVKDEASAVRGIYIKRKTFRETVSAVYNGAS
jgi:hypothetical protein